MAKLLSILLILNSSFCSFSQDTLNQTDKNDLKQGYWIVYGKDDPESDFCSHCPIKEGRYLNDARTGVWIQYHSDSGQIKLIGNYANNRPHGHYEKYYPDGKLKEFGNFVHNSYLGEIQRFYASGCLESSQNYNEKGLEGPENCYHYDDCNMLISKIGHTEFQSKSDNGRTIDTTYRYYPNGDLQEFIRYDTLGFVIKIDKFKRVNPEIKQEPIDPVTHPFGCGGRSFHPNGYNKVYNNNDDVWQDGDFKDGQLQNGKVYTYDSDGILLKIHVFKNGLSSGK